jgi:curli biogenesis system outer membrane secretion channel CsgG
MNKLMAVILAFGILCSHSVSAEANEKITIAIGEIEYRAKDSSENKRYGAYGKGSREDTRAFVDMLTTALVKTRKFKVIERDRMAEILKEQGLSLGGVANGGFEGDGLNLAGVDFIVTGAITEYGETSKSMKVKGFSSDKTIASMAVDIRVLKVADGSIGFAESVRAEAQGGNSLNVNGFASGGDNSSSALLGQVMRDTSINVTNVIVSNIYPIKIVAITKKGDIMLNYGNGLLQKGDHLNIFSLGETFVDPDTGEELGSEEELVGEVAVFSAQAKFSKAKVIEGADSLEKGMIARVVHGKKSKEKQKAKKSLW